MADARDGSPHHSYGPSAPDLHRTEALPSDVPCKEPGCTGFRSAGKYQATGYCPKHRREAHRAFAGNVAESVVEMKRRHARWERLWNDAEAAARGAWDTAEVCRLVITPSTAYFAAAGAVGHAWVKVRDVEFGAWLRNTQRAETDGITGGARLAAPEGPLDRQRAWVNAFVSRLQAQGIRAYMDSRLG